MLWLFVGPTGVYLLDFFCSGIQFNLLLSPYPCFTGLEIFFGTYSSCGASGLKFSLVLTPVELVLKNISNIKIENNHMICRINNTKLCYP